MPCRMAVLFLSALAWGCYDAPIHDYTGADVLIEYQPADVSWVLDVRDPTDWDAIFAAEREQADLYGELADVRNRDHLPEHWAATLQS